jgi:hypothetical protein
MLDCLTLQDGSLQSRIFTLLSYSDGSNYVLSDSILNMETVISSVTFVPYTRLRHFNLRCSENLKSRSDRGI